MTTNVYKIELTAQSKAGGGVTTTLIVTAQTLQQAINKAERARRSQCYSADNLYVATAASLLHRDVHK